MQIIPRIFQLLIEMRGIYLKYNTHYMEHIDCLRGSKEDFL
jgi:hypothetical protein